MLLAIARGLQAAFQTEEVHLLIVEQAGPFWVHVLQGLQRMDELHWARAGFHK